MRSVFSGYLSVLLALLGPAALAAPSGMVAPAASAVPAGSAQKAEPPPQMDAANEPVVEGPLTLENTKCDRKKRESDGEVVAVIKRCLRFYRFDTTTETDPTNDYGVVWLQSNVKARSGWCTKRAASDILIPDGVPVHSFQPKGRTEIEKKAQRFTTELVATAGGMSGTEASVSQEWLAYPARVKGLQRDDGQISRVKWAGTTKTKLGFAGGAEISWTADAPPEGLSYQLNFALGSPDAC